MKLAEDIETEFENRKKCGAVVDLSHSVAQRSSPEDAATNTKQTNGPVYT